MKTHRFFRLLPLLFLACSGTLPAAILSYQRDAAGRLITAGFDGDIRLDLAYDKHSNLVSRTRSVDARPALAGNFVGIISNNTPAAGNVGPISLKMLPNGSFTGKLTLAGVPHSFGGSFAANGSSPAIVITRKPPLANLTLTLSLDVLTGMRQVSGNLTDGGFLSNVVLGRAGYDTKTVLMPAGLAGKYTAVFLPEDTNPIHPQGIGYATLSITASAGLTAAGKLADGSTFTHSSTLLQDATWLFFVPLYKNAGHISGPVQFQTIPGDSDFGSYLTWFKPATTGLVYPAAFTTHPSMVGSRYLAPAASVRALDLDALALNALFSAEGGGLVTPLSIPLTLDAKNLFVVPLPNAPKLKLTLTSTTGLFTGSFVDGTATRQVGGVLVQKQNVGAGFFMGATQSGPVEIEENP